MVPQNGMVLTGADGCIVYVNHNSTTPFPVPATYSESNGQLAFNARDTVNGIPATIVQQSGGQTCGYPTFSQQSCSGQSDAVCISYIGTYTLGVSGFPKLTDN
jgi:hypothetical protein